MPQRSESGHQNILWLTNLLWKYFSIFCFYIIFIQLIKYYVYKQIFCKTFMVQSVAESVKIEFTHVCIYIYRYIRGWFDKQVSCRNEKLAWLTSSINMSVKYGKYYDSKKLIAHISPPEKYFMIAISAVTLVHILLFPA